MQARTSNYLTALLARQLRLSADRIDPQAAMEAYGIDSVMVLALTDELEKTFGPLPKTLFFEYQTIDALAGYFAQDHAARLHALLGTEEHAPSTAAPAASPPAAPAALAALPAGGARGRRGRGRFVAVAPETAAASGALDIAIIGLNGRYPKADTVEAFWENLAQGVDCITEVPADRWDHGIYFDAEKGKPGKAYSKWGGFINGMAEFDPVFFNISPRDAIAIDPQERLFLQCVYGTLEDAGYTRDELANKHVAQGLGGHVGVFVGVMYQEYQLYGAQAQMLGEGQGFALPGNPASIANRVSHFCNFHGPSLSVDTMCSSSLTAIHLACQSILRGDCAVAIAGGVNVTVHPNKYLSLSQGQFASSEGLCRSFGEGGDGYVPGEGVGAVLLKPLAMAVADGDHIHGVIKGSALNHGGKTNGFSVPNPNAQGAVIQQALEASGVHPRTISFLEAHGTGTSLGDPIEIAGLTKAFSKQTADTQFCAIGSAKSNIGHCESAAGIAALTKVLLQLRHRQIARSLHSETLNPHIDFSRTPFVVQQQTAPWERPVVEIDGVSREHPRIAGISSFGAGGSNAHLIVAEHEAPAPARGSPRRPLVAVLSARTEERLKGVVQNLLQALARFGEDDLDDIVHTLQSGREAMDVRLACVVSSLADLRAKLSAYAAGERPADVHEGKRGKDALGAMAGDEDMRQTIDAWVAKGKLSRLAELWVKGLALDWRRTLGDATPRRISLPTYPFAKDRYWILGDARLAPAAASGAPVAAVLHPLLHANTSDLTEQSYTSTFTGEEFFLRDHRMQGRRVLPGVAQLEMARQAVQRACGGGPVRLERVVFAQPVAIDAAALPVRIVLQPLDGRTVGYEIRSGTGDAVTVHGQGRAVITEAGEAPAEDLAGLHARTGQGLSASQCQEAFGLGGLGYGPAFQGLQGVRAGRDAEGRAFVIAPLALPGVVDATLGDFDLHPSLADAALQASIGFVLNEGPGAGAQLPFGIEAVEVFSPIPAHATAVLRYSAGSGPGGAVRKLDIQITDEAGRVCVRIGGFTTRAVQAGGPSGPVSTTLLVPAWRTAATSGEPLPWADRHVLLCGIHADVLLAGARVRGLDAPEPSAEGYMALAVQVMGFVKGLLADKPKAPVLLQVVVPWGTDAAALSGLLKSAAQENPKFTGQLLQVPARIAAADLVAQLAAGAAVPDAQVRWQDGKREVLQMVPLPAGAPAGPLARRDGVYLITGGAGGLGLLFARVLAADAASITLVLTGRSATVDAARQQEIDALQASGAQVIYRAVDVTDRHAVQALVDAVVIDHGPLTGVIHSAGVVKDSFLLAKDEAGFRAVLAPKVHGLANLDEATAGMPLEHFIAFSSTAAVLGNMGQTDYACANAFMDQFVHARAARVARGERNGRSLSVNWPLWQNGGMQVDDAVRQRMWVGAGLVPLPDDDGIAALRQALGSGEPQVAVLAGDFARIEATLLRGGAAAPAPAVAEAPRAVMPAPVPPPAPEASVSPGGALLDKVHELLRQVVSAQLSLGVEELDPDTQLSDFGYDSVSLTALGNTLNQRYRLELSPTVFFEYPTLGQFAAYLVSDHAAVLSAQLLPAGAPAARPVQTAVAVAPAAAPARPVPSPAQAPARLPNRFASRADAPVAAPVGPSPADEPIAIVGISASLPQAADVAAYWQNLVQGRDCIDDIPDTRWDWDGLFGDPRTQADKTNARRAGVMPGMAAFDAEFFGISPEEAMGMDPQQRLLMTHVWLALEEAGHAPSSLAGSDTALFVGTMNSGYGNRLALARAALAGTTATGGAPSVGPNRMSFLLDLHGPSEPVETACSSALVAMHRAVQLIRSGQCRLAIVGGINTLVDPSLQVSFSKAGMLCEDGRCKTFSKDADGYVRGEGAGIVLLKRLSDAERDGDHIHGLIRGTAQNHGGRANWLTAPNPKAQAELIKTAFRQSGIDPRTVNYIEAHGTGTAMGDAIEVQALKAAFQDLAGGEALPEASCGLGSVKTNIGHLELASGVASVIKVLLQMKHRTLVKSLHCAELSPYLKLEHSPFYVVQEAREWAPVQDADGRDLPRRAGVSAFGFGGVNAHVVLEEYVPAAREVPQPAGPVLIVLSARSADRLVARAVQLRGALDLHADHDLADIAFTLQEGRDAMAVRLACVAGGLDELRAQLDAFVAKAPCAGLYRGDGAQGDVVAAAQGEWHAVARQWVSGGTVDWSRLRGDARPRRVALPTYPFAADTYWIDVDKAPAFDWRTVALHPLLHRNTSDMARQRYTSTFTGDEFFLQAQQVHGRPSLPDVALLEMARHAAGLAAGRDDLQLEGVVFDHAVCLAGEPLVLHVDLQPARGDALVFEICSESADGVTVYGHGKAVPRGTGPAVLLNLEALRDTAATPIAASDCLARCQQGGVALAASLSALQAVWHGVDAEGRPIALATLAGPTALRATERDFGLHPSLLAAALQLSGALAPAGSSAVHLASVSRLEVRETLPAQAVAIATVVSATNDVLVMDVDVADTDGHVCAVLRGVHFTAHVRATDVAHGDGTPETVLPAEPSLPSTGVPAEPARLEDAVLQRLIPLFGQVLKLGQRRIGADDSFAGYGVDSLAVVQLHQALGAVFKGLSTTLLFEHPSPRAIAAHLASAHAADSVAWTRGLSAPIAPAPVPPVRRASPAPAAPSPRPMGAGHRFGRGHGGIPHDQPIAIIGLSGRYAQSATLDAFWEDLQHGRSAIREVPAERWPVDGFYSADADAAEKGQSRCKWGGFLDGFNEFDPVFFGISPFEAQSMDPQERLFLQASVEVMEDAGYSRALVHERHGGRVGVFAGITTTGFSLYLGQVTPEAPYVPHTSFGSVANRVSYHLDLNGPSMPVDTMSSSSLTAIHEACVHLRSGECEMAIAGGVNLHVHPSSYFIRSAQNMLSDDGKCRSFGAGANGYVPGEGVGAVLLKPLAKAIEDGDPIHGVIRGSAINHGGRTHTYTVPNPKAQADLVARVLEQSGVHPRTISYVEAHGIGTALGDPIEIAGLAKAFGAQTADTQYCAIGSVKSNIGHCESAGGIAALTKVLLQMKHRTLVKSLNSEQLNPNIDFARSPFSVQRERTPWERPVVTIDGVTAEHPRIAGVSSFGAGGANAHLIVEEHVSRTAARPVPGQPVVVVLSAKTEARLQERASQLLRALDALDDNALDSLAYTLQVGRDPMESRLAIVASTLDDVKAGLQACIGVDGVQAADFGHGEGGVFKGQVKRNNETLTLFSDDDELQEAIGKWLQRGKLAKLAAVWVKGMAIDWDALHGAAKPRRISLPAYPFARDRYWRGTFHSGATAPSETSPRTVAEEAARTEHPPSSHSGAL